MRKYYIFLISLFVIGACTPTTLPETEWCFIYDFELSDYGFDITNGEWIEGEGIQSVNGNISVAYEHDEFVALERVVVTVARTPQTQGTLALFSVGTVFGVDVSDVEGSSLPDYITIGDVTFYQEAEGTSGKAINTQIVSQDLNGEPSPIIVSRLIVYGNGDLPFSHNPCGQHTPTPQVTGTEVPITMTFTPSPTFTPTPTVTPSPTFTPSPTATDLPPNVYTQFYDLKDTNTQNCLLDTVNDASIYNLTWTTNGLRGNKSPEGQPSMRGWVVFPTTLNITGLEVTINYNDTCSQSYIDNGYCPSIVAIGTGGSPINGTDYYNHNADSTTHTEGIFDLPPEAHDRIGFYINAVANYPYVESFTVQYESASGDPLALAGDFCNGTSTPSLQPSQTAEPTIVTATSTASVTPFDLPTSTPYNYQPTVDLTQITATPSLSPQPTSTNFPQSTAYVTQTIGATTPTPSVEEIRENEAEWELLEEEQRSNNVVENLLQDILEALEGDGGSGEGTGDGGSGEGTGGSGGIGGLGDWANSISDSLYGISELFGNINIFVNQSMGGVSVLVSSFYTAPLEPIPGLPLCVTAPLEHDICAVYYILDWTLFAPNTIGSFIVPLLLSLIRVTIVLRVLRYVLKLVNRTEDVTR